MPKSKTNRKVAKKRPGPRRGTVSKYYTHVKERLDTVRCWKAKGLTDEEIAGNLGISQQSLIRYKHAHCELREALKTGKADADAQVINALFKRAVGFEYEEVETVSQKSARSKTLRRARVRKTKKYILPDVVAQIFYLKNRCSGEWHDRQQHEIGGPDGMPLQTPVIHAYVPDNGRRKDNVTIAKEIKDDRKRRTEHAKV